MYVKGIVPKIRRDYILELLKNGRRVDERGLLDYRNISISTGVINNANGSAQIKLGDTFVVVGIKASIGSPYADEPNKGVIIVNSEFPPVASPSFEPGPPDENAIELARVVDRGIRESKFVDLEKLTIIPGEKVWIVWVDIYILNHDGNLIDAAGYAALAALLNAKLPKVEVSNGEVKTLDEFEPLPLGKPPIYITHAKIGESIVVDPTLEEELVMDARLTMAITADGKICAVQKGGLGTFRIEEVEEVLENALNLAPIIRRAVVGGAEDGQV